MKFGDYPKIPWLVTVAGFRAHLGAIGIDVPCDDIVAGGSDSPLGQSFEFDGMRIGNRLGINPMEGWDKGQAQRSGRQPPAGRIKERVDRLREPVTLRGREQGRDQQSVFVLAQTSLGAPQRLAP